MTSPLEGSQEFRVLRGYQGPIPKWQGGQRLVGGWSRAWSGGLGLLQGLAAELVEGPTSSRDLYFILGSVGLQGAVMSAQQFHCTGLGEVLPGSVMLPSGPCIHRNHLQLFGC